VLDMKPHVLLRLYEFRRAVYLLAALVVIANAHAQDLVEPPKSDAPAKKSRKDVLSKWLGPYDPLSRACTRNVLTLRKTDFTWGDCKRAKTRLMSVSETDLAIAIDSDARCGWAGWIVALTKPAAESRAVDVNAYRTPDEYQAKQTSAFCAYSKRS
jgi:hypothetical protein